MQAMRKLLTFPAYALAALALLSCGGDANPPANLDPTARAGGAERTFHLGISSLPSQPTEDSYEEAFKLASQAGEVILIQRAPPWSDFLPGGSISSRTERLTRLERDLAGDNDLDLFLAIDFTVPGDRGTFANLPVGKAGKDFSDADIRSAFINYAKYLALNYKPAYLALGVEVDMYFAAKGDGAFRNFLSLYFQAYDEVKSVSKDTLVFPTFQYEEMQGLLRGGSGQLPAWGLVQRFEPKIDMLAVSSFPSFIFSDVQQLPMDYYTGLKDRIDKPLALVSVGWSSTASRPGESGEAAQVSYLYRVLSAADDLDAQLLVWYLGRDPLGVSGGPLDQLGTMGLQDQTGAGKSVWRVWLSAADRPPPD
jgi:hypothetical protein